MAKVRNLPGQRRTRRYEGIMHTATQPGGGLIFKAWPPKRGKTKPGPVADMRQAFGWACKASVTAIDLDKIAAETITKASMYYPRDALISAMYGTLVEVRLKDGTIYRSAREVNTNAQIILDTISDIPGTMLVRGATDWIGIAPGTAGNVLTTHGPAIMPSWELPSGGGGGSKTIISVPATVNSPNTYPSAAKANLWIPQKDITIDTVIPMLQPSAGQLFAPFVAQLSGILSTSTIVAVEKGQAVACTGLLGILQSFFLPLDNPYLLKAGLPYIVGCYCPSISAGTSFNIGQGGTVQGGPVAPMLNGGAIALVSNNPTVGQVPLGQNSATPQLYIGASVSW